MKIFSATQFFNELDLLEIRLETLDPVVDYFIVSESTKTHSGLDKPLYYSENADRYKKFHHKIIHQVIGDTPGNNETLHEMYPQNVFHQKVMDRTIEADWFDHSVPSYIRDTYEKEALLTGLRNFDLSDIVLLGDLDEIPSPGAVELLKNNFDKDTIYHFHHSMFYYYLNLEKADEKWRGTMAMSIEKFLNQKVSFCRERTYKKGPTILNGGWHFSYIGGIDKIRDKLNSFGEQSLN